MRIQKPSMTSVFRKNCNETPPENALESCQKCFKIDTYKCFKNLVKIKGSKCGGCYSWLGFYFPISVAISISTDPFSISFPLDMITFHMSSCTIKLLGVYCINLAVLLPWPPIVLSSNQSKSLVQLHAELHLRRLALDCYNSHHGLEFVANSGHLFALTRHYPVAVPGPAPALPGHCEVSSA